jgi:hypothetical protein
MERMTTKMTKTANRHSYHVSENYCISIPNTADLRSSAGCLDVIAAP